MNLWESRCYPKSSWYWAKFQPGGHNWKSYSESSYYLGLYLLSLGPFGSATASWCTLGLPSSSDSGRTYSSRSLWLCQRTFWVVDTFYLAWFCSKTLSYSSFCQLDSCKHYCHQEIATRGFALTVELQFQEPVPVDIIAPSFVIICAHAVTFVRLQTAQTHRIREMAYKHLQNSC